MGKSKVMEGGIERIRADERRRVLGEVREEARRQRAGDTKRSGWVSVGRHIAEAMEALADRLGADDGPHGTDDAG